MGTQTFLEYRLENWGLEAEIQERLHLERESSQIVQFYSIYIFPRYWSVLYINNFD